MNFTLISPRIAIQKGDFLGSGIPYWPLELATMAAVLRQEGHALHGVDLFGSNPFELEDRGQYFLQGAPLSDFEAGMKASDVILIYAISYMSHQDILDILSRLRILFPSKPLVVLENSQAVTAYAIPHMAGKLFDAGATALICGEPYWNLAEILGFLTKGGERPANVLDLDSWKKGAVAQRIFQKPVKVPIPAWDLFPIKNYWKIPYSHGPKTARFLPIMTSRGCPYPCDFCVVPETNQRKWRPRPAEDVVGEMIHLRDQFGIHDFQIEDLNPTVDAKRMDEFCKLLIDQDAGIRFYIVSGTKAETIKLEQVPEYARAGCKYVSISPESGSVDVMKAVGKPFNYEHGEKLVAACHQNGIRTQACFIVGHPSETDQDHRKSVEYLKVLMAAGLDEAAFFIVAPFAGSQIFQKSAVAIAEQNDFVSFSPKGRKDYLILETRRRELIRVFFIEKIRRMPRLLGQFFRSVSGRPQTKMENLPLRVWFIYRLIMRYRLKLWASRGGT